VTGNHRTAIPLVGDVALALAAIPTVAGVGQILGPEGRNLIIGKPANLRRWAATQLGAGKPSRKGARPPTDLTPIATAIVFERATSPFRQRLAYERLMARYVPPAARRDLRPPFYLHLDLAERFPRITIQPLGSNLSNRYGPFRDRRTADGARQYLHKRFALRPCDFVFEPDPALPLGLGCLYAQVRSCSAPCLGRIGEEEYRRLAARAAAFLSGPDARSEDATATIRRWVTGADPGTALVVEHGTAGLEVYPVRRGAVLEEGSVVVGESEALDAAIGRLRWPELAAPRDDSPWLSAWLHAPRRKTAFVLVDESSDVASLAARIRSAGAGTP
jgi:hypothetical protein